MSKAKEFLSSLSEKILTVELKIYGIMTKTWAKLLLVAVFFGVIVLIQQTTSLYVQRNVIMVGLYLLLSLSLNYAQGYLGHCFLGMAGFYSIGAYCVAILTSLHSWSYLPAVIFAVLFTALIGVIFALLTLRSFGTYLCTIAMAFFYIEVNVVRNLEGITNGAFGIGNIPAAKFFGMDCSMKNGGYLYLVSVYIVIVIFITNRVMESRVGRAIKAVRDDELVSTLMGVEVGKYKVIAYALCGAIAGLAGSVYGPFLGYIKPTTFTYDMGMIPFVIIILGGTGSIGGAILGSIIVAPLGEYLRMIIKVLGDTGLSKFDPDQWRYVIYGLILVVMMVYKPQGLLGGQSRMPMNLPKGVKRGGEEEK